MNDLVRDKIKLLLHWGNAEKYKQYLCEAYLYKFISTVYKVKMGSEWKLVQVQNSTE